MVAIPKDLKSQVLPEVVSVVPPVRPGSTLHIDGDYLAYFAAGGDGMALNICRMVVRERCEKMRVMAGCEKLLIHLSDPRCTKGDRRFISVTQPYQGQRLSGKKPGNWAATREYIESGEHGIPMKVWMTREADDGAAYCCETRSHGNDAVASKDKDWRMFAGWHLDWDTFQLTEVPVDAFHVVGRNKLDYGHWFFWYQMLIGDTADHIPGISGCGKGRAPIVLADATDNATAFDAVAAVYQRRKRAAWADYMVEQAALLWMRTDREASLVDFLKVFPYNDDIMAEAKRMTDRVATEKAELESILNAYNKSSN